MGAYQSGFVDETTLPATGYCQLGTSIPVQCSHRNSFSHEHQVIQPELAKTPFHAIFERKNSLPGNMEPLNGQCFAYSQDKEVLYIAFGAQPNSRLSTDLIAYNVMKNRFFVLMKNIGEGRVHASMVRDNNYLYIFGGNDGNKYLNEFLRINVETKEIVHLPMDSANAPSPRSSAVIAFNNGKVIVWGGNNGFAVDGDIHVFDTVTMEWSLFKTSTEARFEPGYVQSGCDVYIFGSSKGGLLKLDTEEYTIEDLNATGCAPQTTIHHPSLVCCGNYILCFGGSSNYLYSHLFAYDISKNWWFVFHVKPSESTIRIGEITDLGLFKFPRQDSQSVFYNEKERKVYFFFGSRLEDHVPIYEFSIGEALSLLNVEKDLTNMLF